MEGDGPPPPQPPAGNPPSQLQIPQISIPEELKRKQLDEPTQVEQMERGVVIATHESLQEASRSTGVELGSISAACNGSLAQIGGYSWRFASIHQSVRGITVQQADRIVSEQPRLSPNCPVLRAVHPAPAAAPTGGASLAPCSTGQGQDNSRLDALIGTTRFAPSLRWHHLWARRHAARLASPGLCLLHVSTATAATPLARLATAAHHYHM